MRLILIMIINTEGIVLRQRKIANNRRMIVLFTKQYGKLSAGTSVNEKSRSKAALALRPFTYAEYDIFKGREAYSINSASVSKSFYSIGEDIDRFMTASAFVEYLDKVLPDGEPMPKLFDLSLDFLQSVSVSRKDPDTLLYAFIVKTLGMLGVAPELGCCVNCGRRPDDFGEGFRMFSVSGGDSLRMGAIATKADEVRGAVCRLLGVDTTWKYGISIRLIGRSTDPAEPNPIRTRIRIIGNEPKNLFV
jgi:DNA repair protein RecO (recombination protein O)